jgi:general stress protein 26
MAQAGVANNEDLSGVHLNDEDRRELLTVQTECTVIFAHAAQDGWPSGVVMSFMEADGALWLTSADTRAQVKGIESDPRMSIVISNAGTALEGRRMLALRGRGTVHRDTATKQWFYPRFAARLAPGDPASFERLLDSPKRVVIEFRPIAVTASHDSRKMAGDGRGGGAKG